MKFKRILFSLFIIILLACQSSPDFDGLKSEILDYHQVLIDAHWNKDVAFFVKDISEDFMVVRNGEIQRPTREEITSEFNNYLNRTTFKEYRYLQEPIIGFSKDGSLAWSIVQVKVAGTSKIENGSESDPDFTAAWITLFERQGDRWIRRAEVSNFK